MGNTFPVLFRSVAVVPVDPVGNAQRCPQVHRRHDVWVCAGGPAMVDEAEADRAEIGGPAAVVLFEKTYRLASQRFADVDRGALPADLAIVAHASDGAVLPIVGLAQNAVEVPRRCDVMVGRRVVAESLVRALIIVQGLEGTKALELLSQAARRRIGGVLQQRQMQPLQSSVLLRFGRCNAL